MRLSMWVLYDWLKSFDPKSGIICGEPVLQNIRLFSDERRISGNTVYISESGTGGCILVNGRDLITLDCDDTDLILNEVLDAFEFYNDWENSLERAIINGCSAAQLLDFGKGLFPENLLLADASFRVYADSSSGSSTDIEDLTSAELPIEALLAINVQENVRVQGLLPYIVPIPGYDETVTACNLFIFGRHVGWLIARGSRPCMTHGERQIMAQLGRFAEKWIIEDQNTTEHLELTAPFLDILNGTYENRNDVIKSLKALGWNENDKKTVYYFKAPDVSPESMRALDKSLDRLDDNAYCFYYENNTVLVCNFSLCSQSELEKTLIKLLKLTNTRAGKSPVFTDIFSLGENYRAALIAALHSSSSREYINEFSDAVLPYISYVLKKHSRVDILDRALAQLRQYDASRGTELYITLKCFLENESNYTDTAKALGIHRSTLLYRLERICDLTDINLSDPGKRLHLEISFLLEDT